MLFLAANQRWQSTDRQIVSSNECYVMVGATQAKVLNILIGTTHNLASIRLRMIKAMQN